MGPNLRFCPTGCREMVRAHTSNQRYRNNYIRFRFTITKKTRITETW